jgi:4-diphosphocytidyl-2-C-methyl-D-erythritol kinase
MIVFPNSKLNLGLNITGKRRDGYHNLETVFYPIPLRDVLEAVPADDFSFAVSGLQVQAEPENNLCVRAVRILESEFPLCSHIKLHLHKVIPMGSGLGGGSADAAFTLELLNRKFNLALPIEKLLDYALQLGSDCPFFIVNQPCFATGRGEFLQKINLDLKDYSILIVNPGTSIDTSWAFSQLDLETPGESIQKIIDEPPEKWRDRLVNDFEEPVFNAHPELKSIKNTLYDSGAIYASMTGSGSTMYGLFKKKQVPRLFEDSHYMMRVFE